MQGLKLSARVKGWCKGWRLVQVEFTQGQLVQGLTRVKDWFKGQRLVQGSRVGSRVKGWCRHCHFVTFDNLCTALWHVVHVSDFAENSMEFTWNPLRVQSESEHSTWNSMESVWSLSGLWIYSVQITKSPSGILENPIGICSESCGIRGGV
jgi:hypothetical protein